MLDRSAQHRERSGLPTHQDGTPPIVTDETSNETVRLSVLWRNRDQKSERP